MGVNKVAGYSQRGWLGTPGWGDGPHLGAAPPPRTAVGGLWRGGREGEHWAGAVGRGQDRLSPGRGESGGPQSPWAGG